MNHSERPGSGHQVQKDPELIKLCSPWDLQVNHSYAIASPIDTSFSRTISTKDCNPTYSIEATLPNFSRYVLGTPGGDHY